MAGEHLSAQITVTSSSNNNREIRPLTGVRGFAAGLVLLTHFYSIWTTLIPSARVLERMADRGALGVDLFFVLSGFILNYVYFDPARKMNLRAYRSFVWHRFIRVWPVHFATLGLLGGLLVVAHFRSVPVFGNYSLSVLPFQLTMTHAWLGLPAIGPDQLGTWAWNYPSWSISAEWFAYLFVFPTLWGVLKYLPGGLSFLLAYAAISLWALVIMPGHGPLFLPPLKVSLEFTCGALLYNVFHLAPAITRQCQRLATLIFIVLVCALLVSPEDTAMSTSLLILLFPIWLLGLTSETSLIAKLFATAPALWLGRVSFSLYMTQAIVQKILKPVFATHDFTHLVFAWRLLIALGIVGLLLATASGFYYLVENPARNYLRARETGRPGPQKKTGPQPAQS